HVHLVLAREMLQNHARARSVPHSFADDTVQNAHGRSLPRPPSRREIPHAFTADGRAPYHRGVVASAKRCESRRMVRALSLLAAGALSMLALACGESSQPTQAAPGGQASHDGGGSAGDAPSGGSTAVGQHPTFLVIDLLPEHALQSGDDPLDFE